MTTFSLADKIGIVLALLGLYVPTFLSFTGRKLTGEELQRVHPEHAWVRWGFPILGVLWFALTFFLFFVNVMGKADLKGSPMSFLMGLFAAQSLFHGLFTIVTGVCPVPIGHVVFFVLGDKALRNGVMQSLWSVGIFISAAIFWGANI